MEKEQQEVKKELAVESSPDSQKKSEQSPQKDEKKKTVKRRLYLPGIIFGELTLLVPKKWRHATIFALESSSLLSFSNYQISKIIKELTSKAEFLVLLDFLTQIFPDFANLSNSQQRKIIDCFKPVVILILILRLN